MNQEEFRRTHPDVPFLSPGDVAAAESYLRDRGVIGAEEFVLAVDKAGEGNMNCTLRAQTESRSVVVKQSRPWVEKYPEIAAPWDRVLSEARFYMLTSPQEAVAAQMPDLIELDPRARVLVLEDLGEAGDFTRIYQGTAITRGTVRRLAEWLSHLHGMVFNDKSQASLTNTHMRNLNHEHIFRFPLDQSNGLDLDDITPGLCASARRLTASSEYVTRVAALGEIYLTHGPTLLHGDFFPGSWLDVDNGPAIIDPEFAFFGKPEFDLGVFLAHLYLSDQDESIHSELVQSYTSAEGFDWQLTLGFCAVEIMRRLIGVAQLPLAADLDRKTQLLSLSHELIVRDNYLESVGLKGRVALEAAIANRPGPSSGIRRA